MQPPTPSIYPASAWPMERVLALNITGRATQKRLNFCVPYTQAHAGISASAWARISMNYTTTTSTSTAAPSGPVNDARALGCVGGKLVCCCRDSNFRLWFILCRVMLLKYMVEKERLHAFRNVSIMANGKYSALSKQILFRLARLHVTGKFRYKLSQVSPYRFGDRDFTRSTQHVGSQRLILH